MRCSTLEVPFIEELTSTRPPTLWSRCTYCNSCYTCSVQCVYACTLDGGVHAYICACMYSVYVHVHSAVFVLCCMFDFCA